MNVVTDVITGNETVALGALFRISMWWRILYGFLRLTLGITFLRLIGQPIADFIYLLMSHELAGKAGDAVLEQLYRLFVHHDFTVSYFIASYFIFWGVIEIVLSICLLRHNLFAFPVSMGLIVLFIAYSIFRFFHTHSLILLSIILVDIAILYLIHREYRRLKGARSLFR